MKGNSLYDRTDDRFKELIGKKVQCLDKDGKNVLVFWNLPLLITIYTINSR